MFAVHVNRGYTITYRGDEVEEERDEVAAEAAREEGVEGFAARSHGTRGSTHRSPVFSRPHIAHQNANVPPNVPKGYQGSRTPC